MNPILPIYQTKTSLGMKYMPRVDSNKEDGTRGWNPGVLITIASKEDGKYDTENSATFNLGYYDTIEVHQTRSGFPAVDKDTGKGYIRLIHKYKGDTKTLWIKEGNEGTVGWMISVGGSSKMVYCQPHHMVGIYRYLDRCIDQMIAG